MVDVIYKAATATNMAPRAPKKEPERTAAALVVTETGAVLVPEEDPVPLGLAVVIIVVEPLVDTPVPAGLEAVVVEVFGPTPFPAP